MEEEYQVEPQKQENNEVVHESKAGIGILCTLFLGLIGLLIGFLLYKYDKKNMEYEWNTFFKAWIWTFCICIVAEIVFGLICYVFYADLLQRIVAGGGMGI